MLANLTITAADPSAPLPRALLAQSQALLESLFPSEANHFLTAETLGAPHIDFFLAKDHGEAAGCLALANFGTYGEVKSMFVVPAARGRGIGDALPTHVEAAARGHRLGTLRLETGQPGLEAAHRLYARHGFKDCAAFGDYPPDAPHSRYMELSL